MKIGIFGNTNNYPYTLALGFRKIGVEVALVVNRKERLNRPEGKNRELEGGYPNWILDCSDIDEWDFAVESVRIVPVLNFLLHRSSGMVLNDLGPSLPEVGGVPAISLLTGSDLTYYADFASGSIRSAVWSPDFAASPGGQLEQRKWRDFVRRQREGIKRSIAVSFGFPGLVPAADELLSQIGVPSHRRFCVYLSDTIDLRLEPPPLRRKLRVFNGARLNWADPFPPGFTTQDNKRTDILLRGFASFLKEGGKGELVLVEKGLHVQATADLVNALGIGGSVVWLKEMTLGEFYDQVRAADVVCEQLGPSFPGMAALDALALGRPVLGNFRLDLVASHYPERWPVLNADSPGQVCERLIEMYRSPDARKALGAEGRRFAEAHLSPESNAVKCLERLDLHAG